MAAERVPAALRVLSPWTYVRQGGLAHLAEAQPLLDYRAASGACDHCWSNKHGAICTITGDYWTLEILFDGNRRHCGDQLRFRILERYNLEANGAQDIQGGTELNFLDLLADQGGELITDSDAFSDETEAVVFFRNGINLHFQLLEQAGRFLIDKITSPGPASEATRALARTVMTPLKPWPRGFTPRHDGRGRADT